MTDYKMIINLRELFRLKFVCKRLKDSIQELYRKQPSEFDVKSYFQIIFLKEKASWLIELMYNQNNESSVRLQVLFTEPESIDVIAEVLTLPSHFAFTHIFICFVFLSGPWLARLSHLLMIQEKEGKKIYCDDITCDSDCGGQHEMILGNKWQRWDDAFPEFTSIVSRMSSTDKAVKVQFGPPDDTDLSEDSDDEDGDGDGDEDGDGNGNGESSSESDTNNSESEEVSSEEEDS